MSLEAEFFGSAFWRANSVSHEAASGRLAARSLPKLGELENHVDELFDRRSNAGADIVEAVACVRLHRQDVGLRAITYIDEIIRLTAVSIDRRGPAIVYCVQNLHDQ